MPFQFNFTMVQQYTPKEKAEIVQLLIQNNFSSVKTNRSFHSKNKVKSSPGDKTVTHLYTKFVSWGNKSNASHASRQTTRVSSVEEERPVVVHRSWASLGSLFDT